MNGEPVVEAEDRVRMYLTGLGILIITAFLSNCFGFLEHPEQVFDVPRSSALAERLSTIGFAGQLIQGTWLGLALVFDVRPARRVVAYGWLLAVLLFFVPMPGARDDVRLAPMLSLALAGMVFLGSALEKALRPQPV